MKKLVDGLFFPEIEAEVSRFIGKSWRIKSAKANSTPAMHEAVLLRGNEMDIYVKLGTNDFSLDQFQKEALGLQIISEKSGVATPEVIEVLSTEGTALLIMQAVNVKPMNSNKAWEALGRGLAQIHNSEWTHCGLATHNYLGVFRQDNRLMDNWAEFYAERRLRVQIKMAVDAGNMTIDECKPIEVLINKMSRICGPEQPFSLLHGDPWPGNLLYNGIELVAIDCSIYYGNREIDLSTVDFFAFSPVPKSFFDAYHEVYPIDSGYKERKKLWQINQWLGHVTLCGKSYIPKLMDAVTPYI